MCSFASNGRVFVLGAGASAFAGYPLAPGLLGFIRDFDSVEVRTREIASRILDKLNTAEFLFYRNVIRNPDRVHNLEELLTYLELYHSFPGTLFQPWDSSDSDSISRLITEKFLYYQWDLNKVVSGNGRPVRPVSVDLRHFRAIADGWGKHLKPGDIVLTFNWDILHETIFWNSGLWSYKDGYGFQCGTQGNREVDSKVLLLKLHGFVNWVQEEKHHRVTEIANVGDFFHGAKDWDPRNHYSQAQIDSGRKLVLPTYLKDISENVALLGIWTKARLHIAQAQELIVVGYSLNQVDHPARLLFGTALSANIGLRRVTVVAPDATEWESFLNLAGKEISRIPKKFEEWICPG